MLLAALLLVPLHQESTPAPSLWTCGFDEVLGVAFAGESASTKIAPGAPLIVERIVPGALDGVPDALRRRFGTTDECKPAADGRLLIASSGGAVLSLERRTGEVLFSAAVPNAHSIAALPGGGHVAAASVNAEGNRLMVYGEGGAPKSIALPSAHGVVHDAGRAKPYALGMGELLTFDVDAATGALTPGTAFELPGGEDADGHDLRPVPRSAELLVTTRSHVWLFDRDHERFRLHPDLGGLDHVKSVDVHPRTGRIAFVQADEGEWWSDTVRFANPPGRMKLEGERFYKARWDPSGGDAGPARAQRKIRDVRESSPEPAAPSHVRLLFGSCADEDEITAGAWRRSLALAPDGFVLLGDTPYIDSTEPAVQRRRYEEFAAFPPFRDLAARTPIMASVWDDHDFGRNDVDGRLPGKENSRAAFVAARTGGPWQGPYGSDGEGIHSSFRRGPFEVFLLDTRWFARTEQSEHDPEQFSLLGAAQWEWLREGLRASEAPFKILACGMVWNGSVRPFKTDHWGAYPAEFEGLCRFLGEQRITGVLLVGGDIHRPRAIEHDTAATVGYPLLELISSPMHERVIGAANRPHPGLLFDSGKGQVVLELSATEEMLRATFHRPEEVLFEVTRTAAELARR